MICPNCDEEIGDENKVIGLCPRCGETFDLEDVDNEDEDLDWDEDDESDDEDDEKSEDYDSKPE